MIGSNELFVATECLVNKRNKRDVVVASRLFGNASY